MAGLLESYAKFVAFLLLSSMGVWKRVILEVRLLVFLPFSSMGVESESSSRLDCVLGLTGCSRIGGFSQWNEQRRCEFEIEGNPNPSVKLTRTEAVLEAFSGAWNRSPLRRRTCVRGDEKLRRILTRGS